MSTMMIGEITPGKYHGQPSTAKQKANFAEMLRAKSPPRLKGDDRAFMEGRQESHGLGDMPEFMQKIYVENAQKAGVNIAGKVYNSSLARAGMGGGVDPMAWVGDRGEVKASCIMQGRDGEGYVTPEIDPGPDCPLAEDIIQEYAAPILAEMPVVTPSKVQEVREMIIDKHAPKYHPRKRLPSK